MTGAPSPAEQRCVDLVEPSFVVPVKATVLRAVAGSPLRQALRACGVAPVPPAVPIGRLSA
jgi:hypothetical protein